MRVREDFRTLTGPEKAALLLLAIGEEHATKLIALMDEDEIKEISTTMANLGMVSSTLVEKLFIDFSEQISSTGSLVGSFESTERLLNKVMQKDRVSMIMEEIRGPAGRTMWDKLGNVNEVVLANYLKNEYPQTVAVVLSKVKPEHAARVLGQLPEGFAMEVVMRMLRMEAVNKDVLDDVEKTLRNEFMSNLARTARRDAHEMIAEIFNNLDRSTETRFITALEERNRNAAERIKGLMFTFEDLSKLDAMAVQALLRNADKEKIPIALKGASEGLRELFFSNMSERAGKIMREEMQAMGPVRLRDVDEAQGYIVQLAKDLAAKGEIVMADNKEDDELIYQEFLRAMALVRKFEFDLSFDAGAEVPEPEPVRELVVPEPEPPPAPTFFEYDIDAARQQALLQGRMEGEATARETIEQRLVQATAGLAHAIAGAAAERRKSEAQFQRQAAGVMLEMTRRLFPALARRQGTREIEDLLTDAFAGAVEQPRLVVRCAPDLAVAVESLVGEATTRAAFAGTTKVVGDGGLSGDACRVEWPDGGVERVTPAMIAAIDQAILRGMAEFDLRNPPNAADPQREEPTE